MLRQLLEKHGFHLFALFVYGLCYLVVMPFGEGEVMLIVAFILWVFVMPVAAWLAGALIAMYWGMSDLIFFIANRKGTTPRS